jgi:hypothetical protein
MLPGISGSLIAGSFLADTVLPEVQGGAQAPSRTEHGRLQRWWRRLEGALGPASSARGVLDVAALPLAELLGYEILSIAPLGAGFTGVLAKDRAPIAVLQTTLWGQDGGGAWRDAIRAGRSAGVAWGVIVTGRTIRIVDASRPWARRGLEFSLPEAMRDERSATLLRVLCDAATLASRPAGSLLDQYISRSDAHGLDVCASLGDGVLESLGALANALAHARVRRAPAAGDLAPIFDQALTLVYRLLFLLFAEARRLVPTWHQVYREAYSVDALQRRSARHTDAPGLWAALQAISRLAHAGCRIGDLVVTPFNGRLFSPRHTPLAERARISDRAVGHAVRSLATRPSPRGRVRVSYADLDVEQLGAVYERVLDYEPASSAGALGLTRTSTERKATGSFYTPRSMTEFLVRRTLHPLVADRAADEILRLRVLDPAMGSGAFLVAACRYLADAADRALERDSGALPEPDRRARRIELRRTVAERCLYGVDLNPMAVQLARLSLWLTTLAADRPLTFLDHHLAVGDSLVGAGVRDLHRQRPGPRPSRPRPETVALPLFDDGLVAAMATAILPKRYRLAAEPSTSPAIVRAKEHTLAAMTGPGTPLARWKRAADFWCAAWFAPERLSSGVYDDTLAAILRDAGTLNVAQRRRVLDDAAATASTQRFFHWELEFPEVFFDADGRHDSRGGFDAIIGNPPWDALRADTGTRDARERARPERESRLRFYRDAGVYRLQGAGHVNRYQLFLDRALQLVRPEGRIGLILPSGLATDHGSAPLRRALFDEFGIERLHGFDNRRRIFPIHRDTKFLLLTGTRSRPTERLNCVFGRSHAAWLDTLPDHAADDPPDARPIAITPAFLRAVDPDHLAIPLLTSPLDLQILAQVVDTIPKLGDAAGWHVRFGRELNATEDRGHFVSVQGDRRSRRGSARLLTVIEGKHLAPFQVLPDPQGRGIAADVAARLLDPASTFDVDRLAYRDVASATNRVTLIAAILPAGCVSTHTVFCLKARLGRDSQHCLLALLNSLIANYLVRLQVTTHVTTALMARLPVPRPAGTTAAFRELASLARSLEQTGVEANVAAFARLNALVAHLYGLSHAQYVHIVGTFPLLPASLRADCLRSHEASHRGTETQR